MAYGELYIQQERPTRNLANGQFLKGHVPFNKGKRWNDFMSKDGQEHAKRGWLSKEKVRGFKRSEQCGRPRRKVIALSDGGSFLAYDSIEAAAYAIGVKSGNITRCCSQNASRRKNLKTGKVNTEHKYKGIRFYYEDDPIWLQKITN